MKKSIVITLHLLYWVPKFADILSMWYTQPIQKQLHTKFDPGLLNTVNLIIAFISFYVFYLYLFPIFLAKKKIKLFIGYGLATSVVTGLIMLFIWKGFLIKLPDDTNFYEHNRMLFYRSMPYAIIYSGIFGCLFKGFITWYSDIRVKEQLQQKNLQTEIALLKAQINPHFLFNTINNIDILIEKDAKAASVYLKQLSDMMRFMLYETSSGLIPLSKEIEYIEKYIELQKIRTANKNYVSFTVIGNFENLMIAPAIFIPFIENAFKHSTNKKIDNAIDISLEIKENNVSFACLNIFDNSNTFKQEQSGLGVELIRQRLHLLYNGNHKLDIQKSGNQFKVKLNIITS